MLSEDLDEPPFLRRFFSFDVDDLHSLHCCFSCLILDLLCFFLMLVFPNNLSSLIFLRPEEAACLDLHLSGSLRNLRDHEKEEDKRLARTSNLLFMRIRKEQKKKTFYLPTASFFNRDWPLAVLESSVSKGSNSDTISSLRDMLLSLKHLPTASELESSSESSPKCPRSLQYSIQKNS